MKGSAMRVLRALAVVVLACVTTLIWAGSTPAQARGAHQLIQGSGSSWAANAVTQWIADVHQNGLQVVFSSQGSAQGRSDFANKTVDFGVSDIGYQGKDPISGANDSSNGRTYAYLPIVAGGTALPYNIIANGKRVVNLRLSGETIAKIFTQKITNWNDNQITKDNNGKKLPSIPIIPVQHSEGSGSSYQFTRYLSKQVPGVWSYGAREYFPPAGGSAVAQNGSDGVMNFLTSRAANGAIGYDEYSYALGKGFPVIKVLNKAGYYTLPNQYNVAVALTKAKIDRTTLLQNLDQVYTYSDSRAYPISSYSYAIIPTAAKDATMNTAKRQTLADYLQYSVCQGQAEMGKIGYSPLPLNLVQDSFDRVKRLHTADAKVDVSNEKPQSCHNPTFVAGHPDQNYLAKIAPKPEACDKVGAGPCIGSGNTGQRNPGAGGTVAVTGNAPGGGSGSGSGSGASGKRPAAGAGPNAAAPGGAGRGTGAGTVAGGVKGTVDPNTGQLVSDNGSDASGGEILPASTTLAAAQSKNTDITLGIIAGGLLLAVLTAPPLIAGRLARRRGTG